MPTASPQYSLNSRLFQQHRVREVVSLSGLWQLFAHQQASVLKPLAWHAARISLAGAERLADVYRRPKWPTAW